MIISLFKDNLLFHAFGFLYVIAMFWQLITTSFSTLFLLAQGQLW